MIACNTRMQFSLIKDTYRQLSHPDEAKLCDTTADGNKLRIFAGTEWRHKKKEKHKQKLNSDSASAVFS